MTKRLELSEIRKNIVSYFLYRLISDIISTFQILKLESTFTYFSFSKNFYISEKTVCCLGFVVLKNIFRFTFIICCM